jgi:protein-L-isoaspartate(D-aspartate) O-methyltransferase
MPPDFMADDGYARERAAMVREQLMARGISDERVLDAMGRIPRHRFVPPALAHTAYEDHPIPIGEGQTISQPYMVAAMTELLELRPEDKVLEIGTGSGYQTAVLAAIAREVYSIERHPELTRNARWLLDGLGLTNVHLRTGDGSQGWPEHAPFDAILVTAGGPSIPRPLTEQLAPGGRMVCPVGERTLQRLAIVTHTPEGLRTDWGMRCIFVPLVGAAGWRAEQ